MGAREHQEERTEEVEPFAQGAKINSDIRRHGGREGRQMAEDCVERRFRSSDAGDADQIQSSVHENERHPTLVILEKKSSGLEV